MHFFNYSEIFPSLLTHARRNPKHSNRSCYHRVSHHEHNWKDRKYSKRNGTEVFPNLGYVSRQYWLNLSFGIHTKMKVQVFSVHQLPVQTSSIINQHIDPKKKNHKEWEEKDLDPQSWVFSTTYSTYAETDLRRSFSWAAWNHNTPAVCYCTSRNINTAKAKHSQINSAS